MATITVYSKPDCHLCVEAMLELRRLQEELGFALESATSRAMTSLHRAYFERIPWWRSTARSCAITSSMRRWCASV